MADPEDISRRKEREQNEIPATPRWLTWKFWAGAIVFGTIAYLIARSRGI